VHHRTLSLSRSFPARKALAKIALLSATLTLAPAPAQADLLGGEILEDFPKRFVVAIDQATPTGAGRRSLNTGQFGLFGGRRGENWHVIFEEAVTATATSITITAQHLVAPDREDRGAPGEEFGTVLLSLRPGGGFEDSSDFGGFVAREDHGEHEDQLVSFEYAPCGVCPVRPGQSRLTVVLAHVGGAPEPRTAFLLIGALAALLLVSLRGRRHGQSAARLSAWSVMKEG
jgi:hypothetical protein